MAKVQTSFRFEHTVYKKQVVNLRIVSVPAYTVTLEGVGYEDDYYPKSEPVDRWTVDIDHVWFGKSDIRAIAEAEEFMSDLEDAACLYVAAEFEAKEERSERFAAFPSYNAISLPTLKRKGA